MPKITIITPVYKVEQYLDRCVKSIIAQTFTDFELILVDDGSPDKCPQMCDDWAKKDARIRVIHQENQGQASARNNALDVAKGEYISFVDSDDYVNVYFLETLYSNIRKADADICVSRYEHVDNSEAYETNLEGKVKIYNGDDYVTRILLREIVGEAWLLCDKLFKKECWDDVRLPAGRIYEDNAIVYKLLFEAKTIVDCDIVLYYYFSNQDSTVSRAFNKKHLDLLLVPQEMIEYFTEKNIPTLVDMSNIMYMNTLADMLNKTRMHLKDKALEKELHNKLVKQYKSAKNKKHLFTIKTHAYLFEALYPCRMKLYWTFKGIQNKIKSLWSK